MFRLSHFFYRANGGNFALAFAIMSTVLLGSVALAVDFAHLSMLRSSLQNAADAASLAAAHDTSKTDAQRIEIAKKMFLANMPGVSPDTINVTFPGGEVKVAASATIKNFLASIINTDRNTISVVSQATGKPPKIVEIAFVLDVSGSMTYSLAGSPDRLTALQNAVGGLIDKLKVASTEVGVSIKAAMVPFTMAVNVGMNNTSFVANRNSGLFSGTKWRGCVFERPAPFTFADAESGTGWGAYIYPPMPNIRSNGDYRFTETRSDGTNDGYRRITERDNDLDSGQYGPNFNCTRYPITPLTADLDDLKAKVQSLKAYANLGTLIASGVSWGMRVLSPASPFSEGAAYAANVHKIMIVVTDGEQVTNAEALSSPSTYDGDGVANQSRNAQRPWSFNPASFGLEGAVINTGFGPMDNLTPYGFLRDSKPGGYRTTEPATVWNQHLDQLVAVSNAACTEAKRSTGGRNIEIYTVGVSTDTAPGTRIYDGLRNCASSATNHYYVTDTNGLSNALEKMLAKSEVLRLTQ